MLNRPKEFPFTSTLKTLTSWSFLITWSTKLDEFLGQIFDEAAPLPIVIQNIEGTGDMQTIAYPSALRQAPSLVRVSVREPPSIKIGMETVAAAFRVEYGTHTEKAAQVKIGQSAAATKARFDLMIWP